MMYASDELRLLYLKDGLSDAHYAPPDFERLVDDWDGYDDLVYVQKNGGGLRYFEGWVESCWEALFEKTEYQFLEEDAAIARFVKRRFSVIAHEAQLKITKWTFEGDILIIDLEPQ